MGFRRRARRRGMIAGAAIGAAAARRGDSTDAPPEEYEAAKRGDPVPRFRARLVTDGTLSAEEADELAAAARDEMAAAVAYGVESPFPAGEEATRYVYA